MALLSNGKLRRPDIIKIDAETHEPVILESIKEILVDNDAPDIISEIMPPTIEPMRKLLIDKCGYECYHISQKGLKKVDEIKMRRPYNDYYFTKI